jgi:hypothetical protein
VSQQTFSDPEAGGQSADKVGDHAFGDDRRNGDGRHAVVVHEEYRALRGIEPTDRIAEQCNGIRTRALRRRDPFIAAIGEVKVFENVHKDTHVGHDIISHGTISIVDRAQYLTFDQLRKSHYAMQRRAQFMDQLTQRGFLGRRFGRDYGWRQQRCDIPFDSTSGRAAIPLEPAATRIEYRLPVDEPASGKWSLADRKPAITKRTALPEGA